MTRAMAKCDGSIPARTGHVYRTGGPRRPALPTKSVILLALCSIIMFTMKLFAAIAPLATLSLAQHVHDSIPQVDAIVDSILNKYSGYVSGVKSNSTVKSKPAAAAVDAAAANAGSCDYWMGNITHEGVAAFNSDPGSYEVFRNVMDYGAKGDGSTDDTAAINAAISAGNRCTPGSCVSTTTTPAVVYFPAGTYMVSSPIVDYYYTQLIGNPNCVPTIKATGNFAAPAGYIGLIDGDPYTSQYLAYGSTNVFFRQIRNFIIDTTAADPGASLTGIHWPTSQATSLQNIVFNVSASVVSPRST